MNFETLRKMKRKNNTKTDRHDRPITPIHQFGTFCNTERLLRSKFRKSIFFHSSELTLDRATDSEPLQPWGYSGQGTLFQTVNPRNREFSDSTDGGEFTVVSKFIFIAMRLADKIKP